MQWEDVSIDVSHHNPEPEVSIHHWVKAEETAQIIMGAMKRAFPEGPETAQAARDAFQKWDSENILKFECAAPKNDLAKRWDDMQTKLRKEFIRQEDRGISHGYADESNSLRFNNDKPSGKSMGRKR